MASDFSKKYSVKFKGILVKVLLRVKIYIKTTFSLQNALAKIRYKSPFD